eukprot:CFRG0730T1
MKAVLLLMALVACILVTSVQSSSKFGERHARADAVKHMANRLKVEDEDVVEENDNIDFYFFELYDVDKNDKLDGTELMGLFNNLFESLDQNGVIVQTDETLQAYDANNDGFVDWAEYESLKQR